MNQWTNGPATAHANFTSRNAKRVALFYRGSLLAFVIAVDHRLLAGLRAMRMGRRRLVPLHPVRRKEAHVHFDSGIIAAAQELRQLAALYPESPAIAAQQRRLHRRLPKQFEGHTGAGFGLVHTAPFFARGHDVGGEGQQCIPMRPKNKAIREAVTSDE